MRGTAVYSIDLLDGISFQGMVGAARPVRGGDWEPAADRGDARDHRRVENRPDERQAAAGAQEVSARRAGFGKLKGLEC